MDTDDFDSSIRMCAAQFNTGVKCPGCGHEIDPDWCCCGDRISGHSIGSGHNPVPMGCTCGYAK